MRAILPLRSLLFVVLIASAALARDGRDKLSVRPVLLSEHPDNATHRVYVKGQVITTLRFEKLVDPNKTKMIGWEGRLEPLADGDAEIDAQVFQGKGKVAVVFKIKNLDPKQPWRMKSARLVTMDKGHERAVAVRATVREILPGGSGVVALVVDGNAFVDDGVLTSLWLEIYRHDGVRQAYVQLDPVLFAR